MNSLFRGKYTGEERPSYVLQTALARANSTMTSMSTGDGGMKNAVRGTSSRVGSAEITPEALEKLVGELHRAKITLGQASFGEEQPGSLSPQYAHASLTKAVTMPAKLNDAGDVLRELVERTKDTVMGLIDIQLALENPATREAYLSVILHTTGFQQSEESARIVENGRRISGEVAKALTAIGIPVEGKEFAVVDMMSKEE